MSFAVAELRPAEWLAGPVLAPPRAPARRATPKLRRRVGRQLLFFTLVLLLAAPAATGLAGAWRFGFALLATAIAGWLALRGRTPAFVTFCLWLFLLTPFVRRLADAQAGYSAANVLMLAPYVASAWSVLHLPRFFLRRGGAGQWPVAVVLAAIAYGAVLALAYERFTAGALDLVRWSVPPLLAAYVVANAERWDELCAELRAFVLVALPIISLYGLFQFVSPPDWDARWMLNSRMSSIGQPAPYEVRVFGPLNSPATFAFYLEALLLISLTLKPSIRWLNIVLGLAALAVTLVRSAWLGLGAGLLVLALVGPVRARASVAALLIAAVMLVPVVVVEPRLHEAVAQRVQTLTDLEGDKSFLARAKAYASIGQEVVEHPMGNGLGAVGVSSRLSGPSRIIDGGPLEIALALGVPAGFCYIAMTCVLALRAVVRRRPQANRDIYAAAVSIIVVQLMAMGSATTTSGEIGMLFWLCVGLALGAPAGRPRGRPLSRTV